MKRLLAVLLMMVLVGAMGVPPAFPQVPTDGFIIVDPIYRSAQTNRQILVAALVVDREGDPVPEIELQATVTGANPDEEIAQTGGGGLTWFSFWGPNAGEDIITIRPHPLETYQGFAPATAVMRRLPAGQASGQPARVVFDAGIYNDDFSPGYFHADHFTVYTADGSVMPRGVPFSAEINGANGPKGFSGTLDDFGRGTVAYTPGVGLDTITVTVGTLKSAAVRNYDFAGCDVDIECEVPVPSVPPSVPPVCDSVDCEPPGPPPLEPGHEPALTWLTTLANRLVLKNHTVTTGNWREISINPTGERTVEILPRSRTTALREAAQTTQYSCLNNRSGEGFHVEDTERADGTSDQYDYSFAWHTYSYERARFVSGFGHTLQVEICSIGGLDMQGGWRSTVVGQGQAFSPGDSTPVHNESKSYRIGKEWGAGPTQSSTTRSLGFSVGGGKTPISISGSVSQNASDTLQGSYAPPYSDEFSKHNLNAVNGWWQDDCHNSFGGCSTVSGSSDFQGQVVHGLWEFKQKAKRDRTFVFPIRIYTAAHCANIFGDCS